MAVATVVPTTRPVARAATDGFRSPGLAAPFGAHTCTFDWNRRSAEGILCSLQLTNHLASPPTDLFKLVTTAPRLRLAAFATLVIVCGSAWGCRTEEIVPPPYLPTDAHDAYRHGLEVAGLADTALGRDWSAAAQAALARPVGFASPFAVASASR